MAEFLSHRLLIILPLACAGMGYANGKEALPKQVQEQLQSIPGDMAIGIAVVDECGETVFQWNAEKELPTASAIKTAILVELFARYDHHLCSSPREISRILSDPKHLALAHYSDASRKKVVAALSVVSIQRLGWIMIDKRDETGEKYANDVYNAATNVAIALLGGPKETSRAIHERDESFVDITVNRYMLAARNVTGDNTATPMALASLYRKIAGNQLKTISAEVMDEVRRILHSNDDSDGTKLYGKGGSLSSDPVTRVQAGWYQWGRKTMIFAVMCAQPRHAKDSAKSQYTKLAELTRSTYADLKSAFLDR